MGVFNIHHDQYMYLNRALYEVGFDNLGLTMCTFLFVSISLITHIDNSCDPSLEKYNFLSKRSKYKNSHNYPQNLLSYLDVFMYMYLEYNSCNGCSCFVGLWGTVCLLK